jgi:LmbE family N-acetylglucosaminyl deacetylase
VSEDRRPPGWTETVRAASALVLAPHFDDEVLGCGGLIAELAAAGGAVRVLFLTDGGGGMEAAGGPGERDGYRRRRREEAAQALAILGAAGWDGLDLPDGALDQHLDAAEQGIRRAILSQRPEIVLCPSPLEVTRDHRAVFAALHRLLAPLRDSSEGRHPADEPLRGLRVLLYEVNHPGHPDLLVDVSAQESVLEQAMACYASQEERHPYWNAGLGLRRFRTLSLGPGVKLAEAYRRLRREDFATRSPAQLVRHLGGLPEVSVVEDGPRISVIVRTRDRPALLAEALDSLAAGAYRRAEVVLVNDGGAPPAVPAGFPLEVTRVDLAENRGRAGAAEAGIAAATGDFITFLDDDDLAAPEHLATLAGLTRSAGVRVAYTDAAVALYELDGLSSTGWSCRERRLPYSRDFDPDVLLIDNYIPFNTLLIERGLFAAVGPFDPTLPFFEDWDFLIRLAARTPFHHLRQVTCEYRHFRGGGHHIFGERPRERADFLAVKARVLAKHADRLRPEFLARAVDTLRAEAVEEREGHATARRELAAAREEGNRRQGDLDALAAAHQALSRQRFDWEERFHAVNGDLALVKESMHKDQERMETEIRRLYAEETKLHADLAAHVAQRAEQADQLGRTYAEIERLNSLIRAMESTRAWRVHAWWQRRR